LSRYSLFCCRFQQSDTKENSAAAEAAYMSEVEKWRELPDGSIEFTVRRLPTAD